MQSVMLEGAGSWLSGRLAKAERGLGPCFKTNSFVPLHLEIKLITISACRAMLQHADETCE